MKNNGGEIGKNSVQRQSFGNCLFPCPRIALNKKSCEVLRILKNSWRTLKNSWRFLKNCWRVPYEFFNNFQGGEIDNYRPFTAYNWMYFCIDSSFPLRSKDLFISSNIYFLVARCKIVFLVPTSTLASQQLTKIEDYMPFSYEKRVSSTAKYTNS